MNPPKVHDQAVLLRRERRFAGQTSLTSEAFTLVEMLVVMGVIGVLIALAVPAFTALKGAGDLTKSTYDLAGVLDQARAYAMAQNTYVFVGIAEVDPTQAAGAGPLPPPGSTAVGRLVVAAVASADGTRHYATTTANQGADWLSGYGTGAFLIPLGKLTTLDNLHLASALPPPTLPSTSPMARPTVPPSSPDSYSLGDPACVSTTPFTWPLGSRIDAGTYLFSKVIQFDPEGVARITFGDNGDNFVQWMEIALLPTHGNVPPPTPAVAGIGNQAAIQINGVTGATKIYRP